jgi:hypothetical protein
MSQFVSLTNIDQPPLRLFVLRELRWLDGQDAQSLQKLGYCRVEDCDGSSRAPML